MNETKDETTERLGASVPQSDPPSAPTPRDTRAAGDQPSGPGQNLDVITYTTDVEDLTLDQLGGFFVGWPTPPSRHQFAAVLRSSYRAVVGLDSTTGRVVGFIAAISDGVLTAFLPWLEVLPDYQGRGVPQSTVIDLSLQHADSTVVVVLLAEHKRARTVSTDLW